MEEDENSTLGTGVVAVVVGGEVEARAKKILLAACATLCHLQTRHFQGSTRSFLALVARLDLEEATETCPDLDLFKTTCNLMVCALWVGQNVEQQD